MAFLTVDHVDKEFRAKTNHAFFALSDVQLTCVEGEFLAIVGPTGCGKTTLLRLIAGLEKPDRGTITVANKNIEGINADATLVFQQYSLFPWLNIFDNICFSFKINKISKQNQNERVKKLIDLVGLRGCETSYPYELSGGMQQRAAIARALAFDAKILLLDEPFGALDERTRHRLQEELLEIWQEANKTIIFVTHAIDEAIFLASKVLVMRDQPGKIEHMIPIDLPRPRNRQSKEFLDIHSTVRKCLAQILAHE